VVRDGSHFSPEHRIEGYPLATVANMRSNYIDIDSCYKIDKEDFDLLVKNGCKLETGDVLFSKDGTVGLSFVYTQDTPIVVLSSIAFMRPKVQLVDSLFLSYALQSGNVIDRVMASRTGTALKRIILKDLRRIHVPVPSVQEQHRIASILFKSR
jgi:type I restriction enzyme S subunit